LLAAALLLLTLLPALDGKITVALAQDSTDYPYPIDTPFPDLPFGTDFPDDFDTPFPEDTPEPGATAIVEEIASPTATVNAFQTENAQMREGQVTPLVTQTPAPTITPYLSPTPWLRTPSPAPEPGPTGTSGGMDWGMFWIGFSLPVLAGSGLVLYLLDRRPELFRSRR
jgi:hypothetical protein